MEQKCKRCYMNYLASTSGALLEFIESEPFIRWAIGTLRHNLKPSHVSVALSDAGSNSYTIKYSVGSKPFPNSFVRLSDSSPLIQWFSNRRSESSAVLSREPSCCAARKASSPIADEMRRHGTEICARIKPCGCQDGYLLIGTPGNKTGYTKCDEVFFQTVANGIALEIEKQSYYQASHIDPLTGLWNRQSLPAQLNEWIQRSRKNSEPFALCMIDLDNFKKTNDCCGHQAGDEVLRAAAQIMQKNIRECDLAFRYGGEEFLLLIHGNTRDSGIKRSSEEFRRDSLEIVERLRTTLAERPILCGGHAITVTASIGMSFYDGVKEKSPAILIREADEAVYVSKKGGKNRVTMHFDSKSETPQTIKNRKNDKDVFLC